MAPARIELATQGFSVLCSTDWATEPMVAREGFEPTTSGLWARRATRLLYLAMCCSEEHNLNGGGTGIRTQAPISRPTGFQDRTLQPLGYSSVLVDPEGLEPSTLWLKVKCSTNWAKGPRCFLQDACYISFLNSNGSEGETRTHDLPGMNRLL